MPLVKHELLTVPEHMTHPYLKWQWIFYKMEHMTYPYLKWQWIFYSLRWYFLSSINAKPYYRTYVIRWVSYEKQERLTLRDNLISPPVFL
jgi:hypothetical protein